MISSMQLRFYLFSQPRKLAEDTELLSHTSYFDPKTMGKGMKKSGSGIKVIKQKVTKKVPK